MIPAQPHLSDLQFSVLCAALAERWLAQTIDLRDTTAGGNRRSVEMSEGVDSLAGAAA